MFTLFLHFSILATHCMDKIQSYITWNWNLNSENNFKNLKFFGSSFPFPIPSVPSSWYYTARYIELYTSYVTIYKKSIHLYCSNCYHTVMRNKESLLCIYHASSGLDNNFCPRPSSLYWGWHTYLKFYMCILYTNQLGNNQQCPWLRLMTKEIRKNFKALPHFLLSH